MLQANTYFWPPAERSPLQALGLAGRRQGWQSVLAVPRRAAAPLPPRGSGQLAAPRGLSGFCGAAPPMLPVAAWRERNRNAAVPRSECRAPGEFRPW